MTAVVFREERQPAEDIFGLDRSHVRILCSNQHLPKINFEQVYYAYYNLKHYRKLLNAESLLWNKKVSGPQIYEFHTKDVY